MAMRTAYIAGVIPPRLAALPRVPHLRPHLCSIPPQFMLYSFIGATAILLYYDFICALRCFSSCAQRVFTSLQARAVMHDFEWFFSAPQQVMAQ